VFGRAAEGQLVIFQLVLFLLKSFLLVIFLLVIFLGPRAIADSWLLFMELPFSLAATLCSRRSSMCKLCKDIVNGSFFIRPGDQTSSVPPWRVVTIW
jgi:hypothetical protein